MIVCAEVACMFHFCGELMSFISLLKLKLLKWEVRLCKTGATEWLLFKPSRCECEQVALLLLFSCIVSTCFSLDSLANEVAHTKIETCIGPCIINSVYNLKFWLIAWRICSLLSNITPIGYSLKGLYTPAALRICRVAARLQSERAESATCGH